MSKFMSRLIAILFMALVAAGAAQATTKATISSNVNGMRQLSPSNIVQQYPGAAPYYGPSICQQQLSNFQQQMGPGYACQCPQGAQTPVCTPVCSTLLPTYQQQAGPTYACACPVANQAPVCTPIPCSGLLSYYQGQYPGYICTCPVGAATPQCVLPPPTCAQLLPTYQAQYQAQQGAGVPITCSCPNPNATSNPVCSCGTPYTGYYLVSWGNYSGSEVGYALYYVDASNNVIVQGWSDLWTGEMYGTGTVSSGNLSVGNLIAGGTYNWSGSFSSDGSSGSGSYILTSQLAAGDSMSNQSGWWNATKVADLTTNCASQPPCGTSLNGIAATMSAYGQNCSCPNGYSSTTPPACGYQSCSAAQQVPLGTWNLTASSGATCTLFTSATYEAAGTLPGISVTGSCSDGTVFTNGSVACDGTLGQNILYGSTGMTVMYPNGSGGYVGYIMGGQFFGNSFSGFVEGTNVTVSGNYY